MKNIAKIIMISTAMCGLISCDDFLDREPQSSLSPETYFTNSSQLKAYADRMYPEILLSHSNAGNYYGIYGIDKDTDNQAGGEASNIYADGLWKVPHSESNDWNFQWIYHTNFFLSNVLAKYGEDMSGSQNTIEGSLSEIKHYIGEVYFLRACEYFKRYWKFGDFPIVTEPLSDDKVVLIEANKRMPRNEVARFILSDLDKAAQLMADQNMSTNRINRDVALLLKSRVALYEATWLKYFKGTPFVPNGEGWPGKKKDYNANYEYPTGSIDGEIDYFLEVSMEAAKEIAEKYKGGLTENTGVLQQSVDEPKNPYFEMFANQDLSAYPEAMLWRLYGRNLVTHETDIMANAGNDRIGVTRGLVNNFLMADGTPVYRNGSYADGNGYYMGDKTIHNVRQNRDSRLSIFLKEPGQINILYEDPVGTEAQMVEPYPQITTIESQRGNLTGYLLRKGASFDQGNYLNMNCYSASICYRSVEALLNYMEACYEKNGSLDNSAQEYWRLIRERAHVDTDFEKTIAQTDMNEEAKNDWGAYSGGQLIDATLYNIRRERRCEFLAEGLRYMDLCRWRSMDQMIDTPYFIEGFHLWNTPMEDWYEESELLADGSDEATVSSPSLSEYLRPYQRNSKQVCYDGYTWHLAHYLTPIMYKQFLVTLESGNNVEDSPLYQNPYWPLAAEQPAER